MSNFELNFKLSAHFFFALCFFAQWHVMIIKDYRQ